MTKQILAFLFCFTRELNLYTPLTLTLRSPIRPYLTYRPPIRLRAFRLYKTLVLTLNPLLPPSKSLRQKHGARIEQKISLQHATL